MGTKKKREENGKRVEEEFTLAMSGIDSSIVAAYGDWMWSRTTSSLGLPVSAMISSRRVRVAGRRRDVTP
jgi:hypothetical protein